MKSGLKKWLRVENIFYVFVLLTVFLMFTISKGFISKIILDSFSIYINFNNSIISTSNQSNISRTIDQQVAEKFCGYMVLKPPHYGRMGNQMFYYASFYGMIKKQEKTGRKQPIIPINHIIAPLYSVFDNLSMVQEKTKFEPINMIGVSETGCCIYDQKPSRVSCDGKNISIGGYRQSYKYFWDVRDEIRREFTFKPTIEEKCHQFFKRNVTANNDCVVVGAQMRRGDFVADEGGNGHYPAVLEYFTKAIRYFEFRLYNEKKSKPVKCLTFLVVGDDYQWNLNATNRTELLKPNETSFIVVDPKKSDSAIDLCLMSLCDHAITSVGTFSWWAGFFNKGIVTRQEVYKKPGSRVHREYTVEDFFLPHWISL